MTIDIDHERSDKISIFYDSKPEELAFLFCKNNNLDYNTMSFISSQIKDVLTKQNNDNAFHQQNEPIPEENEEDESICKKASQKEENQDKSIHSFKNKQNDKNSYYNYLEKWKKKNNNGDYQQNYPNQSKTNKIYSQTEKKSSNLKNEEIKINIYVKPILPSRVKKLIKQGNYNK